MLAHSFINTIKEQKKHPNAFVIYADGMLLEMDKFEVGAEVRTRFIKHIITDINDKYFTIKGQGYMLRHGKYIDWTELEEKLSVNFTNKGKGHVGVTELEMKFGFNFVWDSKKKLWIENGDIEQLSLF